MEHTPYGYEIVNGKAVVNKEKAVIILKICENYLNGMSLEKAAGAAGLTMGHCRVKRLLQNKRYLGDDFYPAILSEDLVCRIKEEMLKREKALGRDHRKHKEIKQPIIYSSFSIPRIPPKYKDPCKQAEFAYSLIQSEVNKK